MPGFIECGHRKQEENGAYYLVPDNARRTNNVRRHVLGELARVGDFYQFLMLSPAGSASKKPFPASWDNGIGGRFLPSPHFSSATRVQALIRSASRRSLLVLAVEQLAFALALVLGGLALMLLLGTQILDWYWPALLGLGGLIAGLFRIRGGRLSEYRVAQRLDHSLRLNDSLSTAWFLLAAPHQRSGSVVEFQLQYADRLAQSVEPETAFPFSGGRRWAITGALAAVVFGLFAVRYMVHSGLDLQHTLIPIHLSPVIEKIEKSLSANNRRIPNPPGLDTLDQANNSRDLNGQNYTPQENELLGFQDPNSKSSADAKSTFPGNSQKPGAQESGPKQDDSSSNAANAQSTSDPKAGENAKSGDQKSGQPSPNAKEQNSDAQQGQQGLLDKMKDAMSSLMAKMRPSPDSRKSLQNNEKPSDEKQTSKTASANKDQQGKSQSSKDQQSSQDPNSQGEEQGQTTEKAQASQGKSSDKANNKSGNEAHSGIGRQDGDKETREAEQQQAMGKLAEIIGKRSQSVTGEMMVETPGGKQQQLKTQYSQRQGHHADLGGEINRDEVPLMYQQYVREYMEQVRKESKSDVGGR